jgi:hypothetical protein
MKQALITENVWQYLTEKVKASKNKMYVAVAYFGQGAASMLPLTKGSTLLVDASEKAVKSGQTCPEELLKLYKKGVLIYSLPNLHAKMYVIGKTLFVGSANVSYNSSNVLFETLLSTTDSDAIENAKAYITSFCGADMGSEELKRLQKMYNPSKGGWGPKGKKAEKTKKQALKQKLYVCKLKSLDNWTEEEHEESEKGLKEANTKRNEGSTHRIDTFKWTGKMPMKKYDEVLQVINIGDDSVVYPPGRLIHTRKYKKNGKEATFCYVEVQEKKELPLNRVKTKLKTEEFNKLFTRRGYKDVELANKIYSLWG